MFSARPRSLAPLTRLALLASLSSVVACARNPAVEAPAASATMAASERATTGGFVVRLGADTMVVERYVRTPTRLEAWSVNRQPATVSRHYVVTFENGVPTRMDYEGGRADGSQPMTRIGMAFGADTTTVTVTRDTTNQVLKVAGPALIPAVSNSFALTELAIARFLALKVDSATVATLPLGSPRLLAQSIKRTGASTVAFDYFGAPWAVTLDANGRIVSVDGSQTAGKVLVDRVADVDVAALTRDFMQRDKEGRGFGVASRADSVRVALGATQVAINYSRPARRGRALLGNLVPTDGSVWRTGANAATMLTTTGALDIGGTTVPAGSYTLWTLPSAGGWQLVINKQTKQWGTEYDAKQDFARIPMTVHKAAAAGPELFTIALEPSGANAGTLRLTWGDIDVSVPVVAKVQAASN